MKTNNRLSRINDEIMMAQQAVLVGEEHRAHPERPGGTAVEVELDGIQQARQDRLSHPRLV